MKKEAIRGRVERHRGSDKLILSKRFIAFLQEIRKEACAAKKKPAKPTLEKKYRQPLTKTLAFCPLLL